MASPVAAAKKSQMELLPKELLKRVCQDLHQHDIKVLSMTSRARNSRLGFQQYESRLSWKMHICHVLGHETMSKYSMCPGCNVEWLTGALERNRVRQEPPREIPRATCFMDEVRFMIERNGIRQTVAARESPKASCFMDQVRFMIERNKTPAPRDIFGASIEGKKPEKFVAEVGSVRGGKTTPGLEERLRAMIERNL